MSAVKEIKEQLDGILTQVTNTLSVKNFEINSSTSADYGDGLVGQFYKGYVRDKDTGETTVVAIKKAPPSGDFAYNEIFENEDAFYKTIFPAFNDLQKETGVLKPFNNLPRYFCGGMESNKEYIAMEDLKPLGYVMFDKKQYLDMEHLEIMFKTYGRFHALSYMLRKTNNEKFQGIIKNLTNVFAKASEFVVKPMTAAVSAAINALDPEKDKVILDEIQGLDKHCMATLKQASSYSGEHKCLVHGDCWSNNMLFKYSESGKLLDMKLIDFQMCQENSPIHDLSYFFYSGAGKKDFDNLENYLEMYYESFKEFAMDLGARPDDIFSFEVFRNDWKEHAIYGVILGIYLWQVKLIPKQDFVKAIGNNKSNKTPPAEEMAKIWAALLGNVHKTDEYKERTTAILRHAVEYGVLDKTKIVQNNK